jgi:hypothetical protein
MSSFVDKCNGHPTKRESTFSASTRKREKAAFTGSLSKIADTRMKETRSYRFFHIVGFFLRRFKNDSTSQAAQILRLLPLHRVYALSGPIPMAGNLM